MLFAHDAEVAVLAATALVNTLGPPEELPDPAALDVFVRSWGCTGRRTLDAAELREVRALRLVLREIWHADEERVVSIVNQLLRNGRALPQLVRHDRWDYHVHATPPDAPLAVRLSVEAALAMVDVVRRKALHRLRVCARPDCEDVLVDLTKNRSRLYCSATCGNRAAVAAYRERQSRAGRTRRRPV